MRSLVEGNVEAEPTVPCPQEGAPPAAIFCQWRRILPNVHLAPTLKSLTEIQAEGGVAV